MQPSWTSWDLHLALVNFTFLRMHFLQEEDPVLCLHFMMIATAAAGMFTWAQPRFTDKTRMSSHGDSHKTDARAFIDIGCSCLQPARRPVATLD